MPDQLWFDIWTVNPLDLSINDLRQVLYQWNRSTLGASSALRKRFVEEREKRRVAEGRPKQEGLEFDPHAKPEERLKALRSRCPQKVWDRIERARQQRLFLVECGDIPDPESSVAAAARQKTDDGNNDDDGDGNDDGDSNAGDDSDNEPDGLYCQFVVLGSTGNVYNVDIERIPTCTCPDHAKNNDLCKHILFVLLKVMGVSHKCRLIYQQAWTSGELKKMFADFRKRWNTVRGNGVMAKGTVQTAYAQLKDGSKKREQVEGMECRQQDINEADDCPICFDPLSTGGQCTFCKAQCGANFHEDCIRSWLQSQAQDSQKCPLCRVDWEGDGVSNKRSRMDEGYTNLGDLQGQSKDRDTSTYRNYDFWKNF
mmetsp:Transcript_21405/g.59557  ORF Transcript_21405/g.59557 Transcript_21405/m.59557 type:complete len:369 (-) Transcript_21405:120-1226(-)|eukprot:CAMPEP_0198108106 /NCGR_PEP_ID=MMETSP1442-20131203/195_1 /TAXON_ID= /ORGANISM="Craspedostauros australis, Strain CCMP3328" /LENGTH=368 /DNA_ID=CAMNT_0043763309 /DNA_START=205 /DNA_END=1311 /DNA_ORIENTATION=+